MYAVVRRYSNTSDLADIITRNRQSLEQAMRALPGFVAYYLINGSDGVTTVTVCQDRDGAEASVQRAAEWVRATLPADSGLGEPQVSRGDVLVDAR